MGWVFTCKMFYRIHQWSLLGLRFSFRWVFVCVFKTGTQCYCYRSVEYNLLRGDAAGGHRGEDQSSAFWARSWRGSGCRHRRGWADGKLAACGGLRASPAAPGWSPLWGSCTTLEDPSMFQLLSLSLTSFNNSGRWPHCLPPCTVQLLQAPHWVLSPSSRGTSYGSWPFWASFKLHIQFLTLIKGYPTKKRKLQANITDEHRCKNP